MNSGIYVIRNTKNCKVYLGQTKNLHKRFREHWSALQSNRHRNRHLQHAWNKYGGLAFEFVILEYCPVESLNKREQYWLDSYADKGGCYNFALDVVAPMRGLKFSAAHRKKISDANRGKVVSDETRQKMSIALRGKRASDETRQKLSDMRRGEKHPNFGKHLSEETRYKISEAIRKQPPASEETRRKLSEAGRGRLHTEETRRKIGDAHRGKVISEETRAKMREAAKLRESLKRRDRNGKESGQ